MTWTCPIVPPADIRATTAMHNRQATLVKPPGSLGYLESLAAKLAGSQGTPRPSVDKALIVIFAADHGITAQGVSAYPSDVTTQMMSGFVAGNTAICALARQHGIPIKLVDVGIASTLDPALPIEHCKIALGTRDSTSNDAMSVEQCRQALAVGATQSDGDHQLLIAGEMGIGNTASAAAIIAVLTDSDVSECVDRGTGIDDLGMKRKISAVQRAVNRHKSKDSCDPITALASIGGLEIAALCGAILASAARRVPVLLDGVIVAAAALLAVRLQPNVVCHLIAGHRSKECGHRIALHQLGLRPILELDLRLGEASGAALAYPLVQSACRTAAEMASFSESGVSGPSAL